MTKILTKYVVEITRSAPKKYKKGEENTPNVAVLDYDLEVMAENERQAVFLIRRRVDLTYGPGAKIVVRGEIA